MLGRNLTKRWTCVQCLFMNASSHFVNVCWVIKMVEWTYVQKCMWSWILIYLDSWTCVHHIAECKFTEPRERVYNVTVRMCHVSGIRQYWINCTVVAQMYEWSGLLKLDSKLAGRASRITQEKWRITKLWCVQDLGGRVLCYSSGWHSSKQFQQNHIPWKSCHFVTETQHNSSRDRISDIVDCAQHGINT